MFQIIANYIDSQNGNCEIYPAPFAVYLNEDDYNYLEPDISVICDPSKLDEKGCHGAPDWIIEIASTGSRSMDYYKKLFKYRTAGVREYWIVDPKRKTVTVNYFEKNEVSIQLFFESAIKVNIYDDLYINFSDICKRLSI